MAFCNLKKVLQSFISWLETLLLYLGTRSGFDKVRRACPLPTGQSTLIFLLHDFLLPGIPCFHSLPHPFFRILRLPDFTLYGCLHCDIFASAYLLYRLLVNVPFYCYMYLLHRRIC
jgi:hypothetical protein